MNGTAAADPTLETHTQYRVPTKAGSTLFYSKLHGVRKHTEKIVRYLLFYYLFPGTEHTVLISLL